MALRGQLDNPPEYLLHFRYRERFGMTQEELENEPDDVYHTNIMIMGKEVYIREQAKKFEENAVKRKKNLRR